MCATDKQREVVHAQRAETLSESSLVESSRCMYFNGIPIFLTMLFRTTFYPKPAIIRNDMLLKNIQDRRWIIWRC